MLIASSFKPLASFEFQGYCFVGDDFVVGQAGAQAYSEATGTLPGPNLDGCYVTAVPEGAIWRLGTDSRGLARLYTYARGSVWAIGSSLSGLVEHLRANGVYPNPRLELLEPYTVSGAFTSQPASLQMPFESIELVPSFCTLILHPSGKFEVEPLPERAQQSYKEDLKDYLSVWLSRLLTLTSHPDSRITADLTGGLDSRVVLAFLLASGKFDTSASERFRLVSNPNFPEDYSVASEIAKHYKLSLNGPSHRPRTMLVPGEAFQNWYAHSLGVYLPVYFQNESFDPLTVHAHGAGGESYRRYYSEESLPEKLVKYENKLSKGAFREWASSVTESAVRLSQLKPGIEPLILHYQEFRNRFHFGHRPHRRMMFTPLNTGMLDAVASHNPLGSRQHFYDVLNSLVPGLIDFPFDTPDKSPTSVERAQLTTVDFRVNGNGRIFGLTGEVSKGGGRGPKAYERWLTVCETLLRNKEIRHYLNEDLLVLCETSLAEAKAAHAPLSSHHPGTIALSVLHAYGFALAL